MKPPRHDYAFHLISASGKETYEEGTDWLSLSMRSNTVMAKHRQSKDPVVKGSFLRDKNVIFFLHDEHWISAKHMQRRVVVAQTPHTP